jgi:hypothetical protein
VQQVECWWWLAACYGSNVDFFPEDREGVRRAQEFCRTCLVIEECAEEGLFQPRGVWGGMSETQRRKERQTRRLTGRLEATGRPLGSCR